MTINEDILKGNWKQLRGHVREWWGRLTDDEIEQINGRKEILGGMLQEKYGYTRQEAETAIQEFLDKTEAELEYRFQR